MDAISPFQPLKLLRHADAVQAMLAGGVVYPISVEFDLSNTCPHDCPFCSFGTSASGGYRQQNWVQFPTPRALSLLDELHAVGVQSLTFTGGGEPLVHKAAPAILEKAAGLFQFGVVTNGLNLRGAAQDIIAKHATFVRVSLDAGTPETHQCTHGTPSLQFHAILDHMRATREKAGDRLTIGASFCMMEQNWKELYQAAKLAKDHGANYLEVRPTFPTEWRGDGWGTALSPDTFSKVGIELAHARAHLDDAMFRIIGMAERFDALATPTKGYDKCRIGPLTTIIGADGRLWHCCVQRGMPGFSPGSVLEQSFADVWLTEAHRRLIAAIDVGRCPRCRYDGLNQVIQDAFVRDGMHAAFL